MIIRGFSNRDITQLELIHKYQYQNEFSLDEFNTKNYLGLFSVVEDDDLICTGGVRTIAEVVLVTDKTKSVKTRRSALMKILEASSYMARRTEHDGLHAFVQDQVWLNQLLKHGFKPCKGTAVVHSL